jgi:hypothetical protein
MAFASDAFFASYASAQNVAVPLLQWKMLEGSGTTLNDSSGNGYTGVLNSSTMWSHTSPSPPAGATYYVEGNGTYGAYSTYNAIYFGSTVNKITLDAWYYSTDWTNGGSGGVICQGYDETNAYGDYQLYSDGAGNLDVTLYDTGLGQNTYQFAQPSTSAWHHFQIVYNNTNGAITVYIDSGGAVGLTQISFGWALPGVFHPIQVQAIPQYSGFPVYAGPHQIFAGDTHTL